MPARATNPPWRLARGECPRGAAPLSPQGCACKVTEVTNWNAALAVCDAYGARDSSWTRVHVPAYLSPHSTLQHLCLPCCHSGPSNPC